jgi:hypothetical protein
MVWPAFELSKISVAGGGQPTPPIHNWLFQPKADFGIAYYFSTHAQTALFGLEIEDSSSDSGQESSS